MPARSESEAARPARGGRRPEEGGAMEERKPCHCKKSRCLKLYCECFAAGLLCLKACVCDGCHNCEVRF